MKAVKDNPDYLMQGTQPSVVLMTDKELLEILEILKEIVLQAHGTNQDIFNKIEKLEKKFKNK